METNITCSLGHRCAACNQELAPREGCLSTLFLVIFIVAGIVLAGWLVGTSIIYVDDRVQVLENRFNNAQKARR